jgi:RNA polymerase sigma-70 factor (ECF subfamily)
MRSDSVGTEARARFERLFAGHYGELLGFAQRRVGIDAAGDVVAETFLIAWRRLSEVPAQHAKARAWLYTTARHVIANELRARQRRNRLHEHARDDIATDRGAAGDHAAVICERLWVRAVLESLSETDQELLRLTEWERLELSEVATVLGCSRTAAKVRLHRARRRFARRLAVADSSHDLEGAERLATPTASLPEGRVTT